VCLNELYETYKDDAAIYLIYVREAHGDDGWRVPENLTDEIHFNEPRTDDERTEVASVCQLSLDIKVPMLIDSIDNAVEEAYIAKPIRLYVIDRDGTVAYNGAQGPRGFDPDAFEEALKAEIGRG
jgi:hypothetical protein